MYKVDWIEDRHLSIGLQDIRFHHILAQEAKRFKDWRENELNRDSKYYNQLRKLPAPHYEVPDDDQFGYKWGSEFYKLIQTYRLGVFLYEQFNRLKDSINQTCQYYYEVKEIPESLQVPPLTSMAQGMQAYYRYENEKFYLEQDGGGFNTLTRPLQLEQSWLVAQIFGQSETIAQKESVTESEVLEKVQLIKHLECVKLGHILWDFVDEDTWPIRFEERLIQKLPSIRDDDQTEKQVSTLRAFCFYLALAYTGIVNLSYDKYASMANANQAWRLSPELEFSIQFLQLISTRDRYNRPGDVPSGDNNNRAAWMIFGHIFPYRVFETKHETQSLNSITKKQYILLSDFELFVRPKQDCTRKAYARRGKDDPNEALNKILYALKWYEVAEHLQIKDLRDYKAGILDVFKKENCSRGTLPCYLKENVGIKSVNVGQQNAIRMNKEVFSDLNLLEQEKKDFVFDGERRLWVVNPELDVKDTLTQIFKSDENVDDQQWRADEFIVQQLTSEQNVDKLLQIIDQIPNLDIKLSTLQQAVVTSRENLLCLGRSGTGKTTSSVLRLFAQEIMYMSLKKAQKHRRNMAIKRKMAEAYKTSENAPKQEDTKEKYQVKLTSKDFLKPSYMKTVFISASPVLVNEVNRFYTQMRDSIISYLRKKEEQEIKAERGKTGHDEEEVKQQQQDLLKLIKIEADQIEQELAVESQLNLPAAFEDLKPCHFPLFLTLKQLLFMLDASLYDSFFFRDQQNQIIGMDNNLSWHNENKGLFMINQQFKSDADYDKLMLEFTNEVLNDVDADDLQKEIQNPTETNEETEKLRSGGYRYKRQGMKIYGSYKTNYERHQLAFEVDYDVFVTRFFNRFKQKSRTLQRQKKLSEALIWTEIFSVIKGSQDATRYYGGILPARKYITESGSPTLTRHELQTVYWIFIEYEKWKEEQNAFDLMDLVIHLRRSNKVSSAWYHEMRMDYLMIDEVQDLTPATLDLLIRLTKNKVFFAGDTAQTIAKGVGARFSDLKQLFSSLNINVIQLTTNYRSHGKILALANSVVNVIETLFPFSIDKLKKEESESDGLRPILLTALKPHELKRFFVGTQSDGHEGLPSGFSANKPQFGCSQVIIVRDQEIKQQVPEFLANMLCLTIYEAKGLEFDDVFLFNFFSGENIDGSHWKLLNDIGIYEAISENVPQDEIFTKIDAFCAQASAEENQSIQQYYKKSQEKAVVRTNQKLVNESTKNRALIYRKYSLLCIELKYLYVAITRPRKRLIIYDEKIKIRQPIQRVWEALGIVDVVNSYMIENNMMSDEIAKIFQKGYVSEQVSTQSEWKLQGIKFFKKKCYDQAIKCFRFADEPDLVTRTAAYQSADLATAKMAEIESNMWRIKNSSQLNKNEKRALQKENKVIRIQAKAEFKSAGQSFEDCGLNIQAASCYFSAKDFERAGSVFERLKQYSQAGECLMRLQTTQAMMKAAELFERGKLITRAIECYEQLGAWEQLLHCLHKNGQCFREDERQRLANRYIPIALNKLYLLLTDESSAVTALEQNKGAIQELKIRRKFENQEAIEEDEEEDITSSEEEYGESVGSQSMTSGYAVSVDVSKLTIKTERKAEESGEVQIRVNLGGPPIALKVESVQKPPQQEGEMERLSDLSYELIDEDNLEEERLEVFEDIFQLDKKKSSLQKKNSVALEKAHSLAESAEKEEAKEPSAQENSFEIIDAGKSESSSSERSQLVQAKSEFEELVGMASDFDHLSQYDPDDEFLQSTHSISILESILNSKVNQSSDFSVIEGDGDDVSILSLNSSVKGSEHMRFIARHQKIEDKIVQKIIYYISLFSTEVKEKLDSLHVGKKKKTAIDFHFKEEEEIILEKIPVEFVEIVLSILEHYDLIRLGLIICNKFKLNHHIGKYVVQSCIKYSNLNLHRYNHFQLRPTQYSDVLLFKQRQASIIAHEAMHNVLGLIHPKYLTLKRFNEPLNSTNSLGMSNYKLMLQLGFWKKLVYATNGRTSLGLCFKFNDLDNYNFIVEKMIEADKEDGAQGKITADQLSQLSSTKLVLVYKCALSVIRAQTKQLDNLDKQGQVWQDIENLEKRFAVIEMQLQDMFFNTDSEMPQLVAQLVTISKYMLQSIGKQQKATRARMVQNLVQNQIQDEKKIEQMLQNDRNKADAYFQKSRTQMLQLMVDVVLPEAKSDDEFTVQCCIAFFLLSFHSLQKQLELLTDDTDLNQKVVTKLQSLLGFCDFQSLQAKKKLRKERIAKKVFFASQNMHPLDHDDFDQEENESLFEEYEGKFYLMNIHSLMAEKLQDLQQKLLATTVGQEITKLFRENVKKYFYQQCLREKIERKLKRLEVDPYATKSMVKFEKSNPLAFMIDLDLQFVLVPIDWADQIVKKRMVRVTEILHNLSTKNIVASLNHHQTQDKDRIRLEAFRFNTFVERRSRPDFDKHFSNIIAEFIEIYKTTHPSRDEQALMKEVKAYHKVQNSSQITVSKAVKQSIKQTEQSHSTSLKQNVLQKQFQTVSQGLNDEELFSTGVLFDEEIFVTGVFQSAQFRSMRDLLKNDELLLQMAMNLLNVESWQSIKPRRDTEQGTDIDHVLSQLYFKQLAKAYFALAISDQHGLFVDSVRSIQRKFKASKKLSASQKLQKRVVDAVLEVTQVNLFVLSGAISMAATKLMVFYKSVHPLKDVSSCTKILEKAFYPVLVGMLGKAFVPKDVCFIFDRSVDIVTLILNAHLREPDCGEYDSNDEEEEEKDSRYDQPFYTEWDRQEITEIKRLREKKLKAQNEEKYRPVVHYKATGFDLEAVKPDQEILVNILTHAIDLLQSMNQDVFNINSAKRLFNMLMAAAINLKIAQFNQKKSVSAYLIKQGFMQLADCPISEYFEKISFQYFDVYNESEIVGLKKMFVETDDVQKYQFFAFQSYLVQIDVTECQAVSKQTNNQNIFKAIVTNGNSSLRQLVAREMAKQVLRKYIRKAKARSQFSARTRKTIETLQKQGVRFDLTGIDQSHFSVNGIDIDLQSIVDYLKQTTKGYSYLRQLVLSKSVYLTTSFDIQMLYQTHQKLASMRQDLLTAAQEIVDNRLEPLRGYMNLELSDQPVKGTVREKFAKMMRVIQSMQALWYLRARATRQIKEIEQQDERTKRLNIKWNSWNQLAKKRKRLQDKIKSLQK